MKPNSHSGSFVVVEGPDGSGTTTQVNLLEERIGWKSTAEPTDFKSGRMVSEMISEGGFSAEAVALMFAADRKLHLEKKVEPALKNGENVVSDRYVYSSLVYQSVMGLDPQRIRSINKEIIRPDLTIVLDVGAEECLKRLGQRSENPESVFERMEFQEDVVERYRDVSEAEDFVVVVDGEKDVEEVHQDIVDVLDSRGFLD